MTQTDSQDKRGRFEDSEALRALLTRLHEAGQDA